MSACPEGVDTVVFDLGGVLIDWDPRHLYRKIFLSEEDVDHFLSTVATPEWHNEQDRGRPVEEATELLRSRYPEYGPEIEAFYARWDEMFRDLIEGSLCVLQEVREQGRPLYAITNWPAETFPRARERWDFLDWFDDIVVSGEESATKPDRELYDVLVRRTGLDPATTVFIDDKEPNVRAAEDLGFIAVKFEDAATLREDLVRLRVLPGLPPRSSMP